MTFRAVFLWLLCAWMWPLAARAQSGHRLAVLEFESASGVVPVSGNGCVGWTRWGTHWRERV